MISWVGRTSVRVSCAKDGLLDSANVAKEEGGREGELDTIASGYQANSITYEIQMEESYPIPCSFQAILPWLLLSLRIISI